MNSETRDWTVRTLSGRHTDHTDAGPRTTTTATSATTACAKGPLRKL